MIDLSDQKNAGLRRSPEDRAPAERRAKLRAYWAVPGRREAHGKLTRAAIADSAVRACISERTTAAMRDPARKAHPRASIQRSHSDPAFNAAQWARAVVQWADPDARRLHGDLTRRKMAERDAARVHTRSKV